MKRLYIQQIAAVLILTGLLISGHVLLAKGDVMISDHAEIATLGGGCFWCLEPVFESLKGVENVKAGYAGGHTKNPDYDEVCTGTTGHAEVVRIRFYPDEISYGEILKVFFTIHDPTSLNRQGADVGTQYRSIIITHSDAQKNSAENMIRHLDEEATYSRPIVTEVTDEQPFYVAEEYHQNYYEKHPEQGYCSVVIAPKVEKFKKQHVDLLM